MNSRHCLALAERMDTLLQAALGCGVQPQRMLADALYARDVLLVCDAHPGTELQALARDWRAARADAGAGPALTPPTAATAARARAPAPAQAPRPGAAQTGRPAPGARPAAGTADDGAPATRPPQHRRPPSADGGRSSFFDRFRPSGPASLPAGRSSTRPLTLGLDGPDTWPPEADGPLPEALDPGTSRPVPAATPDAGQRPRAARRTWLSPARWFDRGSS